MKSNSRHNTWMHFFCILFIAFWIGYYSLAVVKYTEYPWWHRFKADSDNVYTATTLAIVNDGDFHYIHHPGTTVYQLHGAIYQGLALVNQKFQPLLNVDQVTSEDEAVEILGLGTLTSRAIVFPTMVAFSILLYLIFFQITTSKMISCLMTFYIMSSEALLMYNYMIRPEPFNLFYLFLAYYICLLASQKKSFSLSGFIRVFIPVGFCLGYAVFSKIQIIPAVLMLLVVIMYYLWNINKNLGLIPSNRRNAFACLLIGLLNIIIFPWWTMKRPAYITNEYLKSLYDIFRTQVFGPAPANFSFYPFLILSLMIILSAVFYFLHMRQKCASIAQRIFPAILAFNSIVMGSILAVYAIFLPVSRSLPMYLKNTNNMMYGIITNSFYSPWLINKVFDIHSIRKIQSNLGNYGSILNINLFHIVLSLSVWCLIRLLMKSTPNRNGYILILLWFFLGLVTDILGTMRSHIFFDYYAIYSVSFHGIGVIHWLALELKHIKNAFRSRKAYQLVFMAVCCLLILHTTTRAVNILKLPKAGGNSGQDPNIELKLTRSLSLGRPYWNLVDRSIQSHK